MPVIMLEAAVLPPITTALTTAITTIAGDSTNAIAAVIPVAAPVLGAMIVIGVAVKTIRRFTGR